MIVDLDVVEVKRENVTGDEVDVGGTQIPTDSLVVGWFEGMEVRMELFSIMGDDDEINGVVGGLLLLREHS